MPEYGKIHWPGALLFPAASLFAQAAGFAKLASMLRQAGYEIACYTGYLFEELLCGTPDQQSLLRELDVLIDGPFVEKLKSLSIPYRGSTNQRILDVPASLREGKAIEQKPLAARGNMNDIFCC